MTTYTWTIDRLLVEQTPEPNTVVGSNFTISGVEDELSGSVNYTVALLPPDPGKFTPYDQITQAQAIEWTQASLGPDRVAAMEAEVQAIIDSQKIATPQPAPLPWEQPASPPEEQQ